MVLLLLLLATCTERIRNICSVVLFITKTRRGVFHYTLSHQARLLPWILCESWSVEFFILTFLSGSWSLKTIWFEHLMPGLGMIRVSGLLMVVILLDQEVARWGHLITEVACHLWFMGLLNHFLFLELALDSGNSRLAFFWRVELVSDRAWHFIACDSVLFVILVVTTPECDIFSVCVGTIQILIIIIVTWGFFIPDLGFLGEHFIISFVFPQVFEELNVI